MPVRKAPTRNIQGEAMIQRTLATTMRQPLRQQASREIAQKAAKAATPVAAKAAQQAEKKLASVARLAVPQESAWYRLKKSIISFFSNIDIGKREVHGVTAGMAERTLPKMMPGDILLRRTEGSSGNLFIPSWWKHAGVYVGNDEVVDAVFKGIEKGSFNKFLTDGDSVMIVRPKNLNAQQRQAIADYANRQVGKPYDFDFDFLDEARQSCTELANHAVKAGAGKDLVAKNWFGAVTGDGFKNSNFELVWSNIPEKAAF